MKLFLIRHGETGWNATDRIQGQHDSPVTERGSRQITALCHALEGNAITSVVSSPLGRATVAASQLASHFHCDIQYDVRLGERHFGVLEGACVTDLQPHEKAWITYVPPEAPDVSPGNVESVADVAHRMMQALLAIPVTSRGNVCVVSHGHAIQALITLLKQERYDAFVRYAHLNGAYSLLEHEKHALRLLKWGIATHLLSVR